MSNDNDGWIQTFTGKKMYPMAPTPDMICIEDIAHALARICRYGGHCKTFYSVAEHSWFMAINKVPDKEPILGLYALLHDAAEAYLGDMVRPLKHLPEFHFFREAENRLQRMIYEKFGLGPTEPSIIKQWDREMLCHELGDPGIMAPAHLHHEAIPDRPIIPSGAFCFTPKIANEVYLNLFRDLTTRII